MIRVTAFRWVPPFAQGFVRDLRVRWALEEAGLPYEQRLIGPDDQASASYRRQQPFGQVPVYEEDGLVLFESGAIVEHIAQKSPVLMPPDPEGRARVSAWLFAALNSIEPQVAQVAEIDLFHAGEQWAGLRRPSAVDALRTRLTKLADWLGDQEYLENRFTAADLLMTTVLRDAKLVEEIPALEAYRSRCMARPGFKKALADQMAVFAENEPPASQGRRSST